MMSVYPPRRSSRHQPSSSRRRHYPVVSPLRVILMPSNFKSLSISPGSEATYHQIPSPQRLRSFNEYAQPPVSPTRSVAKTERSVKRSIPKPLELVPKPYEAYLKDRSPRRSPGHQRDVLPISPTTPAYNQQPLKPARSPGAVSVASSPSSRASWSPAHARSNSTPRTPKIGPFKFLRQLQGGSFGLPFATQDMSTNRVICTRVMSKAKLDADVHLLQGILTEFLCLKHISSRPAAQRAYLMELYGALQDEDTVLFAMPLMQGNMRGLIQGRGNRTQVRRWVAQMAVGLDVLHAMGIIHRDIKPENMLYDPSSDTIRISNFNVACLYPGSAPLERGCVYTKERIGSKFYRAPEVAAGQWYGAMVDWWALGCVMFELVTGEILFRDDEQAAKYLRWDRQAEGTSYLQWAAELSSDEERVLSGLLDVRPRRRFNLSDLRRHPYFVDETGSQTFDVLSNERLAAQSPKLAMSFNENIDPAIFVSSNQKPVCYATPTPRSRDPENLYDFYLFAWFGEYGLWGRR